MFKNFILIYVYYSILCLISLSYIVIYFSINNNVILFVKENPEECTFYLMIFSIILIFIGIFYILNIFCSKKSTDVLPTENNKK